MQETADREAPAEAEAPDRRPLAPVSTAVLVVDDAGRIVEANVATLAVFGFRPDQLVGRSIDMLVPASSRDGHAGLRGTYTANPHVRAAGEGLGLPALHADGTVFMTDISLRPLESEDGRFTIAEVRDMTHWHRAHERLAKAVLDGSPDAYHSTDSHGLVLEWNQAAEALYGWSRAEAIGRPVTELIVALARRAAVRDDLRRYSETGESPSIGGISETTVRCRDGREIPVEMALITLGAGDRTTFHAFVRDISESQKAAAQMSRAAAIVDSSQDGIGALDLDGRILLWNPAMEAMFGFTEHEVIGRQLSIVVPDDGVEQLSALLETVFAGQTVPYVQQRRRKDGQVFTVSGRLAPILDDDGVVVGACANVRDMTQELAAQEQLAQAAAIVAATRDGIAALDHDRNITLWNPAMAQMYGIPTDDALGRPLDALLPPETLEQIEQSLVAAYAGQSVSYVQERERADGTAFTISVRLEPLLASDRTVVGICADIRDVTEQEQARAVARESQQRLRSIIDNTSAAVSVRDRQFRYLLTNRAFRELAGQPRDSPLAGRPDAEILGADTAADMRVGDHRVLAGEQVAVEETRSLAGRERTLLSQRFPLTDASGQVNAIAEVATDITERKVMERELRERIEWEEHISRAVNEHRLLVYSQPIIDLRSGALWGEELLVRMLGAYRRAEIVSPAEFLPAAERFGLMPLIDRFMIAEGVRLARAGRRVSVNVSASSIQTRAMVDSITDQVAADPEAAPNLTLEITETAALASPEVAQVFSARLAELGAGLALDDFGTGYGSLTELRTLKLETLKIDLSFVQDLASSEEDQRVVKVIIHIANEFGITTTAEGVTDAATLHLLRELGADRAQGSFIGSPAPVRV